MKVHMMKRTCIIFLRKKMSRLLDGVFKQFVKPGDFSALTFLLSAANCILAIRKLIFHFLCDAPLKVSKNRNDFMKTSFRPKQQLNFCQDFCPIIQLQAQTTDARRRNSLHCTAENSIPIPNFQVRPKHILSATSAQFFRYL